MVNMFESPDWLFVLFALGFSAYTRLCLWRYAKFRFTERDRTRVKVKGFKTFYLTFISNVLLGFSLVLMTLTIGYRSSFEIPAAFFIMIGTLLVLFSQPLVYLMYTPGRMAALLTGDWLLLAGFISVGHGVFYGTVPNGFYQMIPLVLIIFTISGYGIYKVKLRRGERIGIGMANPLDS